eukprot:260597_1
MLGSIKTSPKTFVSCLCCLLKHCAKDSKENGGEAPEGLQTEELLEKATQAGFFKVRLFLHDLLHEYELALDCYLSDAELRRAKGVFAYVANLVEKGLPNSELEILTSAVLARLPNLVETDSQRAARLMIGAFP